MLVLHGPNLNQLGRHRSEATTFAEINDQLRMRGADLGYEVKIFQSNYEGALIDFLQEEAEDAIGIIINPGTLAYSCMSLCAALAATNRPIIEVRLTNEHAHEEFHHASMIASVCRARIAGLGWRGYLYALEALIEHMWT